MVSTSKVRSHHQDIIINMRIINFMLVRVKAFLHNRAKQGVSIPPEEVTPDLNPKIGNFSSQVGTTAKAEVVR
jgi:hypothetical protein